jgi:hypothetical protein
MSDLKPISRKETVLTKHLLTAICFLVSTVAFATDCTTLDQQGNEKGIRVPESNAVIETIGQGRVQFYSGPDESCAMKGIFILPHEQLTAYGTYLGFTSVMYMNPKTGNDVEGWIKSSRVKYTGYGIGPN